MGSSHEGTFKLFGDQPGRLLQGPEEKNGRLGFLLGFHDFGCRSLLVTESNSLSIASDNLYLRMIKTTTCISWRNRISYG